MMRAAEPLVATEAGGTVDQSSADAALINALAAMHMSYGQLRSARDLIGLSNWCVPNNPETYGLAARLALKRGDRVKAISILRAMRRRNPDMEPRDVALLGRLTRLQRDCQRRER